MPVSLCHVFSYQDLVMHDQLGKKNLLLASEAAFQMIGARK
jgi:hypothetical protein